MAGLYGNDIKDLLEEVLADLPGWASTEDLVDALDDRDAWGDFTHHAILLAKKALVRRLIKQLRDDRGHARVQSIYRIIDGEKVRVYKQESLFDVDDYRQVCAYYSGRVQYFGHELDGLRDRCQERYGVDPVVIPEE